MLLQNILTDIVPIALLLVAVWGIKTVKNPTFAAGEGCLAKDDGKYYRGLFAMVVLLHHLAQQADSGYIFQYYFAFEFYNVAFFFFISGYGLQKSNISRAGAYKKGFLLKRLPSILIPLILITPLYWLAYAIDGQIYSLKEVLLTFVSPSPFVPTSWYLVALTAFYVVFRLLMTVCGRHHIFTLLGATVWYVIYFEFCMKTGRTWWNLTAHLFVVGLFWATYEDHLMNLLRKCYRVLAPACWLIFAALFVFYDKICLLTGSDYVAVITKIFIALFFVLSAIMFSLKFRIGNKILSFFGNYSMEIYLSHGLFLLLFHGNRIYIENDFLWCLTVIAATFVTSYLLHPVFRFVTNSYRRLLKKLNIS